MSLHASLITLLGFLLLVNFSTEPYDIFDIAISLACLAFIFTHNEFDPPDNLSHALFGSICVMSVANLIAASLFILFGPTVLKGSILPEWKLVKRLFGSHYEIEIISIFLAIIASILIFIFLRKKKSS